MKWSNLSKLIDILKEKLSSFEYFHAKFDHAFDAPEKINS